MAKGNYTALQRLKPVQTGIAQDLKDWNASMQRDRRQDLLEDQLEEQKKQAKLKREQELYEKWVKPVNNYETGSASLTEANARLIQRAIDDIPKHLQVLQDENATQEQKIRATMQLQGIQQMPEKLKHVTNIASAEFQAYQELRSEDAVWEDEKSEKGFQNFWETTEFGFDENYNPVIARVDRDGDGIADNINENGVMEVLPYKELLDGRPMFKMLPKVTAMDLAKKGAEAVGTFEEETQQGFWTTNEKKAKPEAVEAQVNSIMKNGEFVESMLKERGWEDGEEQRAALANDLTNMMTHGVDESYSHTKDWTAANNYQKNNKREEEPEGPLFGEAVPPSKGTWGGQFYPNIHEDALAVPVTGDITLDSIKTTDGETRTDVEIQSYTIDNSGKILADITWEKIEYKTESATKSENGKTSGRRPVGGGNKTTQRTKEKGEKVREVVCLNPEDESKFAALTKSSIGQLRAMATKKKQDPMKEESQAEEPQKEEAKAQEQAEVTTFGDISELPEN